MATRVPSHPSLEGDAPISQVGAVGASIDDRVPFRTDKPDPPPHDAVSTVDAFITLARERWQAIDTAESKLRAAMREDLNFFASDQWPAKIKQIRDQDGRPCLTINRQPGFVRQLTNEMRDGRPGIEIVPVDNGADVGLAEVFQGLIQHIEANSDADIAYARAAESQVRVGRGYFRVVPEYAGDSGFEQELKIRSIRNAGTVYFDHASQELDGSDARYAFIVEDIPIPEYDDRFGADSRLSLTQFSRVGESLQTWAPEGKVRVSEYYQFVPKARTIVMLRDGTVLDAEELTKVAPAMQSVGLDPTPVRTREVEGRQLTWALINGAMILEGNEDRTGGRELPGRWIPIVPVYGEEIDLDGRVDYRGIIRDSIDAQRMNNYWKSAMTEAVALAPKAPFVAEEGQVEGHESEWQSANIKNVAVLKYKAKSLDGHLLPPPQRNTAEPPIQAMAMLSMQSENDLRATAGFSYDVGAQEKRLEQSGRAILARQKQGEIGNSHFAAHLAVSLRHTGRILLDLIPKYYDTPRVKRILGRDGQYRQVVLHAGNGPEAQQVAQQQAIDEQRIYDLSAGRYDVRVRAGVSYSSQRQQDQELLVNALQTNPQLMQLIGDLFFKTLDSPIAERISKRLAKALPPGLQDMDEQGPPKIPPEIQAEMQKGQQMIDMLTKAVNELQDQIDQKGQELASKERIAEIQSKTEMAITQAKIAADAQLAQNQLQQQAHLATQKIDGDQMRTTRQIDSAETQTGAKLGAEQAIAMLNARMKQIEQMVAIDMARLQAATQAQPTAASPATTTSAGAAPSADSALAG